MDYPGSALDTTYAYGTNPAQFNVGRLVSITRNGQAIPYAYDRFGRLLQDGTLSYEYDKNGNKTRITYPGGIAAVYTHDFADREATLTYNSGSGPQSLVTASAYKPFGPLTSLSLANGLSETRLFDNRYRPDRIQVGSLLDWDYTEDAVGNPTQITDTIGGQPYTATFTYQDPQYFLTQGNGPWGTRSWTYDKIGNRLTETRGSTTDSYTYFGSPTGGHAPHLQQVTLGLGGIAYYGYDQAGNVVQVSTPTSELSLAYDAGGQLFQLFEDVEDTGSRFTVDGRGFLAEAATETSVCAPALAEATYGSEGLLYQRRQRSGLPGGALTSRVSLFYFAGRPVAQLESVGTPSVKYLTTDHLGTPILAMTGTAASWVGGFEPFGADWSGAQAAGIFLRFPGQWSDPSWSASGLYHNVHRWYDKYTGRYTQREPVVAKAPRQHYLYATVQPLFLIDPDGRGPKPLDGKWCNSEGGDPLGLPEACPDCDISKTGTRLDQVRSIAAVKCGNATSPQVTSPAGTVTVGDVDWTQDRAWYIPQGDQCVNHCLCVHETYHIQQALGMVPVPQPATANALECDTYKVEEKCLTKLLGWTFRVRMPHL